MSAPLLTARDLCVGYDEGTVLGPCSFDLARGEAVALLGPNGAGKTTLLRALAGVLRPRRGDVHVDGRSLAGWPRRDLALRLAYVPQDVSFAFPLTVGEVALMGRYPHRRFAAFESVEDVAASRDALERVGLWELRARPFDRLSGGERRRALLALAFAQRAEILLLDEPTASLDVAHAAALLREIRLERARRTLTVVVATHDLVLAARALDRALLLSGGGVARDGAVDAVLESAEAEAAFGAALYLGRVPGTDAPFCVPR